MPTHYLQISHHQQQHETDCLAACAAMVLDYWSYSVRYQRLLKLLDVTPDLGAPSFNLKYLEALGFSVEYGRGSLGDLEACLAQGIPCIAFIDTAFLSY